MIETFHGFVVALSGLLGTWFFSFMARIIATGYFLFIPLRVRTGVRFYRALFPERGTAFHILCVWRQYHSFTRVILDRMMLLNYGSITFTSKGWRHLTDAVKSGSGGIILMSHMGNWDVAAHLLKQEGLKLLIYMGARDKEQLEKMQKENLREKGIHIVAVPESGGSPLDILEGLNFLREGGLVALTGDMIWKKGQRSIQAPFLGHMVDLPAMPYVLAHKTGVPLFIFFAYRTGPGSYHFSIEKPIMLDNKDKKMREQEIQRAANIYARTLEKQVSKHPREWYHFKKFLGKKIET